MRMGRYGGPFAGGEAGQEILLRAQEREPEQKECGEDPDEGTDLPYLSGANLDESERQQSQAQSGGDTECERCRHKSDECRERFGKIVPVHFGE